MGGQDPIAKYVLKLISKRLCAIRAVGGDVVRSMTVSYVALHTSAYFIFKTSLASTTFLSFGTLTAFETSSSFLCKALLASSALFKGGF